MYPFWRKCIGMCLLKGISPYAAQEFTSRCLRCHDIKPEEILTQPLTVNHVNLYTATEVDVRVCCCIEKY